ncbi:MAG: HAD family hydrolase [Chloroflexota bacterium]|nr:HAD family hydrolase [Chloroflexota bacterium]
MQNKVFNKTPLPSWNEGKTKKAIIDFVESVTSEGDPHFVPPMDRIAVFDNDGTLWSEKPYYFQLYFALDRVKALADAHPEWQEQQPFKAILEDDMKGFLSGGMKALMEVVMATHSDTNSDEFEQIVLDWISSARHPKTGRLYTEMIYQPMLELLEYLHTKGFRNYIASAGGIEFMRAWVEDVYRIPPEQVIGSSIDTKFEIRDGVPELVRIPKIDFIDDAEGKPVGIHKFIGRRPILAMGNSDGDLQMYQWTAAGKGLCFIGMVHHTDDEREWAYDRESLVGKLDKALNEANENGWTVVDMKRDWRRVYLWEIH